MTRLTRADLDALPSYVPGRNLADLTRELGIAEAIKLASNEVPYGPLPGVVEAVAEAMPSSHRYPDMGVVALRDALAERLRRGRRPDRHRLRFGGAGRAPGPRPPACPATRSSTRGARSRRTRSSRPARGATSVRVPNTAGHGHDLAAMADGDHRPDPAGPRLQPEQPDRHGGTQGRAGPVPRRGAVGRAGGARRGVPGVRHRPRGAGRPRHLRRPAERGRCCAPCPRRGGWPACGWATWSRSPRWPPPSARWSPRSPPAWSPRPAALAALAPGGRGASGAARWSSPSGTGSPRRCASSSVDVPSSQANFVWLPLGDQAARVRRGLRGRGVIVRPFQPDGVRVTIGTPEENDAVPGRRRGRPGAARLIGSVVGRVPTGQRPGWRPAARSGT